MIHKIEFSARNLTSNAGLFLLLEHARKNGIFDLINNDLVFENASTNKIKMNHIKTMLCGNLIGIDKLERLKLLQQGIALTKKKVLQKAKPVVHQGQGLVGRLPDSTEDPIAVFKWGERVCAIRDICPHAGFSLADGSFDPETGGITCPEHGSKFQVCTGERLRGPADYPLKTYRAFQEKEEILVEIEQDR